jgi:hypothetical protein
LDEQARALLHRVSADFVDAGTQLLATSADVRQVVSPALASRISMDLAAAPIRADDTVTIIDANARLEPTGAALPRASLGLGTVPSVQADTSNPAAGGQPMMPFMPFGMGMTSSAGGGRERSVRGQGTADPVSWSDPDSGWDVVGRQPPDELVPEPRSALAAERAAQDAIESLMNERWESLLGRGSRT